MNKSLENLLKNNHPVGRVEFFKYTICIAVLQFILSLLFWFFTDRILGVQSILWFSVIFLLVILFPLLYLYLIQFMKRFWDITAKKTFGIILGIIIFVISTISMVIFPVLTFIIYLVMILLPGKIVINEQENL